MRVWKVSFVLLLAILFIPQQSVYGNAEEINNGKPYIEVYDAEGNLVKSYSHGDISILKEKAEESRVLLAPEVTDDTPYVHIFNNQGHLIDSSVDGALEAQQRALANLQYNAYIYYGTSFTSHVWMAGGTFFPAPAHVTVLPSQNVEGIVIRLYEKGDSAPVGTVKAGNLTGGIQIPLSSLRLGTGSYKLQFCNANRDGSAIRLDAGTLYYQPE